MVVGESIVYARERERGLKRKGKKKKEIEFSEFLCLTTVPLCFITLLYKCVLKILVIAKAQNLFLSLR